MASSQQRLLPQWRSRQQRSPAAAKHAADYSHMHAVLMVHSAAQLPLPAAAAARNTQQHSTTAMQCSMVRGKQQALGLFNARQLQLQG
jgi:hypothetical protein